MNGLVETGTVDRGGHKTRCMLIRLETTDSRIIGQLYRAEVVGMTAEYIHVRGYEPERRQDGGVAAVLQEWVVYPKLGA